MCRPTVQENAEAQVLERLQARLQAQLNIGCGPLDHLAHIASRGSGPRVFCGHVPPECTEELVRAHFSQWGHVTDVYFPKRKDNFRRRPFCFVTFALLEDAQRAIAESPMNICGIPIKQLNLVEDRADYYKHRQQAAQSTLVQALQTLALLGADASTSASGPPTAMPTRAPAPDLANLAALLSLENGGAPQLQAALTQAYPMPQALPNSGFEARMPGFAMPPAPLPFANLPGFSQAASSLGGPAVTRPYLASQPAPPIFPPGSSTALPTALAHPAGTECRLSNGTDWSLPAGAASPYSTLDAQHASAASSPPMGELSQLATAINCRAAGAGGSSGSASPDLDAAAANRLAMWQLQNELLAGGSSAAPTGEWAAPSTLVTPTPSAEDEPPLRPCAPPLCACMQ